MQTSEKTDQIIPAFLAAQKLFQPAVKDKVNTHFGQKYSDFNAVWEAVMPHLLANDICMMQFPTTGDDGALVLLTRLIHKSGQFIESVWRWKPDRQNIQGLGSLLTYMKRYALQAICGLPSDDDDGNATMPKKENQQARPVQAKPAAKTPEKFNAMVTEHQKWLASFLEKNKIDKSLFQQISAELNGKTMNELGAVVRGILGKDKPKNEQ